MSHSVFKEYPSSAATSNHFDIIGGGGHHSSAESPPGNSENVVIVLNKDGSVSVDQHALHEFLREYKQGCFRWSNPLLTPSLSLSLFQAMTREVLR